MPTALLTQTIGHTRPNIADVLVRTRRAATCRIDLDHECRKNDHESVRSGVRAGACARILVLALGPLARRTGFSADILGSFLLVLGLDLVREMGVASDC